jgi:hypothetical protein
MRQKSGEKKGEGENGEGENKNKALVFLHPFPLRPFFLRPFPRFFLRFFFRIKISSNKI